MPIKQAGPRLFRSVPFKHLAQKAHGGGGGGDVHLNLTPFVDMMTILVTFLLMVFSATGDILTNPKGMELPEADNQDALQRAPVITISREAISFNGEHMAETDSVFSDTSPQWKVVELFERMKAEKRLFDINYDDLPDAEKEKCDSPEAEDESGGLCLKGLAILQADKEIKAKVINRVLKTANAAGYTNIMFAVNRLAGGGGG